MACVRGALAVVLVAYCAAGAHADALPTALKALQSNKDLSLFTRLAEVAGLRPYLNSTFTRATIFAPTNEAIAAVAKAFKQAPEQLAGNQRLVDLLLGNHIVLKGGNLRAATLKDSQVLRTAGNGTLALSVKPAAKGAASAAPSVTVKGPQNSAKVVATDLVGGNAVIHVIDAVLLPNTVFATIKDALAFSPTTSTLAGLIAKDAALSKAAADPTTNVTLFAPIDKAFATLSASPAAKPLLANPATVGKILAYHAVKGARIVPDFKAKSAQTLPTLLEGQSLTITKVTAKQGSATIGHVDVLADSKGAKPARVGKFDVIAGASLINVIDGVLIPNL